MSTRGAMSEAESGDSASNSEESETEDCIQNGITIRLDP